MFFRAFPFSARATFTGCAVFGSSFFLYCQAKELAPQVISDKTVPETHKAMDNILKEDQMLRPTVFKICLTGGPCAGKSTAVALLSRRLSNLGFEIFIVPEAATILMTGGAVFDGSSIEKELGFEQNKVKVQIALEDAFTNLALSQRKPTVIICDRGTMDSRAYVGPDKWQIMLEENGWTVQGLRDRYDAVFHLVTTAIGAEAFYQTQNNSTRTEDAALARELDLKLLSAWIGHPRVFIIDNSTDFDGKMDRVVTSICRLLGVRKPKQVDRKFVIDSHFEFPPEFQYAKHYTETTYLKGDESENQGYIFLRKRGDHPEAPQQFFYSSKIIFPDGESAVVERRISGLEYSMLSQQIDLSKKQVLKKVRVFEFNRHYFELEEWKEPKERKGLTILKTSVDKTGDPVELPSFIKVIEDVTDGMKSFFTFTFLFFTLI